MTLGMPFGIEPVVRVPCGIEPIMRNPGAPTLILCRRKSFALITHFDCNGPGFQKKKRKKVKDQIFGFPRAPPNPTPYHSFHLSLTLFDRFLTSPYFSFLSFSSFSFSVEHSSSLLQTLPSVPTPNQHLHHHFSGKITGKLL